MRSCVYLFALSASIATAASAQAIPDNVVPSAEPTTAVSKNLPPTPAGHSTVMGGEIQKVDMVRDQLSLKVPAGHTVKILFDERTQVFQNGKRISMLDLHPEDHASIETTLDGTDIFALRIHLMSDLPDGHLHGKVERYNSSTGELKVMLADTKDSVTLIASQTTNVARVGQSEFASQRTGTADLMPGSLVDITFKAGKGGPGQATQIDVLAVPGAEFTFRGNLTALDLRAGRMSIADDSDRPKDVAFEPGRFQITHDLKQGALVKVKARFDGTRFVASDITVE